MTAPRFALGVVVCLVALLPVAFGAHAVRRRILPDWTGVEARLAEVVLALSTVVVVIEILGLVGVLRVGPLTVALAGVGSIAWYTSRRPRTTAVPSAPTRPGWPYAVAGVAAALVAGSWIARTIDAIRHGMSTTDTIWYHLPAALRFVQTGSIGHIQFFDDDPVTAYFPATSSLFHAAGILFFRTDLVSTVVNLGWFTLAVAAGWGIGRPFRVSPASAVGVLLLLATPGLVATQPGGAYDDVVGLALLLAATAMALARREEARTIAQSVVVGLAAGLAVGTKFTFVAPAVTLCLALALVAPRRTRLRHAGALFAGAFVTGSFWYLRNAAATGNPLPSLALHLGPLSLPSVKGALRTSSVSAFLFDGRAWSANFLPGLRSSLGPVWPAIVVLAIGGMVGAVVQRRDRTVRALGAVALISLVAYIVTPQYLVGGFGRPIYFGANLRYASPALMFGLVLLPIAAGRRWRLITVIYGLVLVATQIDPTAWPTGIHWAVFQDRVSGPNSLAAVAVLLVLFGLATALAAWHARRPWARDHRWILVVAVPLVVLIGLAAMREPYLDGRYTSTRPYPPVFAWFRSVHQSRVAVTGLYMQAQYPVAGQDLTNHVQYAGITTADGGFRPARSCAEWVRLLERGRYDYVVIAPTLDVDDWTRTQPDARLAFTDKLDPLGRAAVHVWALNPQVRGRHC